MIEKMLLQLLILTFSAFVAVSIIAIALIIVLIHIIGKNS
jgi:hypothetical protein